MKNQFKLKTVLGGIALLATALTAPVSAVSSTSDKINELISSVPWVGLVAKEVHYGPISVNHVTIGDAGRLAFCKPGEEIKGSLKFKIKGDQLDSFERHHIIVGLRGQDAQSCIVHTLGVWDKKGKAHFSFKAPVEPGLYELCFDYHQALLCEDAINQWHNEQPPHKTTIGVVVVE